LGLATYAEGLAAEGFDTWEMVLNITESNLSVALIGECARSNVNQMSRSALGFKLGHRRVSGISVRGL
jgi:hypothetical protein